MSEQSTSTPTPLWRDPLFSPGDRFPLGPSHWHWEGCDDEPSGPTTRPFSLRGVVPGPRMDAELDWPYRYCEDRQVAFVHCDDGSAVPLLKHTKPGPTPITSGWPVPTTNPTERPLMTVLILAREIEPQVDRLVEELGARDARVHADVRSVLRRF